MSRIIAIGCQCLVIPRFFPLRSAWISCAWLWMCASPSAYPLINETAVSLLMEYVLMTSVRVLKTNGEMAYKASYLRL